MFPQPSDFTSGAGGSAWWIWVDPVNEGRLLYQSQWPTVLRRAQVKLRDILIAAGPEFQVIRFRPDGSCVHGTEAAMLLHSTAPGAVRPGAMATNGKWTREFADALGFMLCQVGLGGAADSVMEDIAKAYISKTTLRCVLWLATVFSLADVDLQNGTYREAAVDNLAGVQLDPQIMLPTWVNNPTIDPRDADFLSETEIPSQTTAEGKDVGPAEIIVPNAPSVGGTRRVMPPPEAKGLIGIVGGIAGDFVLRHAGNYVLDLVTEHVRERASGYIASKTNEAKGTIVLTGLALLAGYMFLKD